MNEYPYYKAVAYEAGILKKIGFGVKDGKKFKSLSECADAIKRRYKNFQKKFPYITEEQILILEYTGQYESKIIEICQEDNWISVAEPVKF